MNLSACLDFPCSHKDFKEGTDYSFLGYTQWNKTHLSGQVALDMWANHDRINAVEWFCDSGSSFALWCIEYASSHPQNETQFPQELIL